MKAVFELPAFARHRADYLDDDAFRALENLLMKHPDKDEMSDLTPQQRKALKDLIKTELDARRN